MTTRAFIAYDFALTVNTIFPNILEAARSGSPAGLEVRYPGQEGDPKEQGTIWSGLVKKEIDQCDKFIAFVDLPNANVGFEIGYACGLGKPVGVYRFKDQEHPWLKQHPLRGHFRHQAKTDSAIHDAFLKDKLLAISARPAGGDGVVVLCPADGEVFLKQMDPAWGWRQPPLDSWSLDESLPKQLSDCGLVVWIITPHGKGDTERDGAENTCLSILAGYAEARPEIDLRIFIHEGARAVADMEHCSRRFKTNGDLKSHLTELDKWWSAKVAARKASAGHSKPASAPAPALAMRPAVFPPLPPDHFAKTGSLFIGRQSELGSGADMVRGLVDRFLRTGGTTGTATIRLLWVHGFGGMGKSWFLHRLRLLGEQRFPEILSFSIDWDKVESRAPLPDIPRAASEVYDLLAIRLCQRLGADAANPYWEAKQRVADHLAQHKRHSDALRDECNRACAEETPRLDPFLANILRGEGFWADDKAARTKKIGHLEGDVIRYQSVLASWCHAKGETDSAVCAPDQALAEGLRESIRVAMARRPLLFLLDTCEVLAPVLDHAVRALFAPLLREPAPVLILVGSRLRADLHQPQGGKSGWRVEIPPETFSPLDFGADRRFTTVEIESALGTLSLPFTGDTSAVASRLHVATLGIPLAVRGLLDLHEGGDAVLSELGEEAAAQPPLGERDQIRKVIGDVAERFLLNLSGRPELEEDLCDMVALALVPRFDAELFARFWGVADTHARIARLASRYSLLSDGDLHSVVRSCLRQHWREEAARPGCFSAVLSGLARAARDTGNPSPPESPSARLAALAVELNLRSWTEGGRCVDPIARALTLALAHGAETADFTSLLRELPPAEGGSAETRNLWHRDGDEAPVEREIVPWLKLRRATSRDWTTEETAALALLEGITTAERGLKPSVALAALDSLEKAVAHFGLDSLPRKASAGEAFFDCAHSLYPLSPTKVDYAASSAFAYERAIALHQWESVACNNVANLYSGQLNRPKEAEAKYREAIRLDPAMAAPHNGLGNLYLDHLNRTKEAEAEYREAIRLDPKLAYPHNGLGNLYLYHLSRPMEAEAEYREAIRLDPKMAHPHHGLGNLYRVHLNRPEEAEAAYREAIRLDSKLAFPHEGLGNLYQLRLDRPKEAEAEYREAIRLDPKLAYPHNELGNLYQYHLNRPKEAEAEYRESIRLDPKLAYPHNGLGSIFEDAGRWSEAEEEFRQGVALAQKDGGSLRGLAWVALRARGDVTGARALAAEALRIDAGHPGSALAALAAEAWAGDWAAATVAFARWVRELPPSYEFLQRSSRCRIAALLQIARAAGQLAAMAAPIQAASGRACWQPWAEALDTVLAGGDASGLSPDGAELHALLVTSPRATTSSS